MARDRRTNNPSAFTFMQEPLCNLIGQSSILIRTSPRVIWSLVCYTAVFSVVTQRSSPQTTAENRTTFLSRGQPIRIQLPFSGRCSRRVCGTVTHRRTRNFFARRGGGVNHLHKKISLVAQIFAKDSKRNEGHITTTQAVLAKRHSLLVLAYEGGSIHLVFRVNTKFEHKLRRHKQTFGKNCHHSCIKMKICHDQGCNDTGVVIARK